MNIFLLTIGILLFYSPLLASANECDSFDQAMIQVEEVRWCNDVNTLTRQCEKPLVASKSYTSTDYKPLYLWTRISGKKAAIDKLEHCGKLPVYHKWYVIKYYGLDNEQAQLIDEIPLCAGSKKHQGKCQSVADVVRKLRVEFSKRGFFDWTTWSYKQHIYKGVWQVRLLYQDNTAVMCDGRPCVYRAKVMP